MSGGGGGSGQALRGEEQLPVRRLVPGYTRLREEIQSMYIYVYIVYAHIGKESSTILE